INGRVAFLGEVEQSTLLEWYTAADIAVVPSLLYESFSYTCAQAMAAGVPVVASRIGGIPETVDDGVSGLLLEPGDARGLARAILSLARDPQLRESMGQAGRAKAQTKFTAHAIAEAVLSLCRSLLEPGREGAGPGLWRKKAARELGLGWRWSLALECWFYVRNCKNWRSVWKARLRGEPLASFDLRSGQTVCFAGDP